MGKSKHYEAIREHVHAHPGCTMSDCAKIMAAGTGMLPRTFYAVIKRACADNVIRRQLENGKWRLYPYAAPHTEESVR